VESEEEKIEYKNIRKRNIPPLKIEPINPQWDSEKLEKLLDPQWDSEKLEKLLDDPKSEPSIWDSVDFEKLLEDFGGLEKYIEKFEPQKSEPINFKSIDTTDLLKKMREDTEKQRNTSPFKIYNDGTVEKKIIIE